MSDDEAVAQWVENAYWQLFCGEEYFQHELPIDPSSMTRWRNRLKSEGLETLLQGRPSHRHLNPVSTPQKIIYPIKGTSQDYETKLKGVTVVFEQMPIFKGSLNYFYSKYFL